MVDQRGGGRTISVIMVCAIRTRVQPDSARGLVHGLDTVGRMTWNDIVTIVVSALALAVSTWSVFYARSSARSSSRSALAAERQAAAAEAAVPPPPPDVAWRVERRSDGPKLRHVLINVGVRTATGVQRVLTGELIDGQLSLDVGDGRVIPGGELELLVMRLWGGPASRELLLTWDGQSEPVAVPVPV